MFTMAVQKWMNRSKRGEADVCHLANAIESSELLVSIIVRRYNFLHFFSMELLGERVDICAEFFGDGAAHQIPSSAAVTTFCQWHVLTKWTTSPEWS